MKTSKRNLLLIIGGVVLAGLIILALVVYPQAKQRWRTPLGPGLELPTLASTTSSITNTQPPASTELLSNNPATPAGNPPVAQALVTESKATATSGPILTPSDAPQCGGPPVMNILAVGVDSRGDDYRYGLSDLIRLVRVDFVTPKVSVLTMPRDLWVEIPGIESHYGITHGKLNQAYFYGTPGMGYYDGPGAGAGLLARTLDKNYGYRPDHYVAVNMETFVRMVDAIGGIDVYLPFDVDGTPIGPEYESLGYFTAGHHHLTGESALRLARIRLRYTEFVRWDNQNLVICALKDKITNPAVLTKAPQLISAFQGSVLTDLSLEQLAQLACIAPKLKRETLLLTGFPQEILKPGNVYSPEQKDTTFIWDADPAVLRDYITRFVNGTWPDKPGESLCPKNP